jgi:hypothetical protein
MVSMILQDVQERASNLERCSQRSRVVSVGEDGAVAPDAGVQATRQAHREPLHRARKRALALSLHYEVNVVRLNRELNQPCTEPSLGHAKRGKHERSECSLSERR